MSVVELQIIKDEVEELLRKLKETHKPTDRLSLFERFSKLMVFLKTQSLT